MNISVVDAPTSVDVRDVADCLLVSLGPGGVFEEGGVITRRRDEVEAVKLFPEGGLGTVTGDAERDCPIAQRSEFGQGAFGVGDRVVEPGGLVEDPRQGVDGEFGGGCRAHG